MNRAVSSRTETSRAESSRVELTKALHLYGQDHNELGLDLISVLLSIIMNNSMPDKLICLIFMDPCIVDYSIEIPTRCSFVIEFIVPKFIEGSTCFERHTAYHQEL